MKKGFIYGLSLIITGLYFVGFHSCREPIPEITLDDFMYITLTGAKNNPNLKKMNLGNSRDTTFNISISYGGTTNYNHGDISATIDADLSLVARFNTANNTAYLPIPAGSYSFNSTTAHIENGKNSSMPLKLTIKKSNLNFSNEYLLPVTIKSVSGGDLKLNEELKTLYLVILADIDDEINQSRWVSGGASGEQAGYEAGKAFDGKTDTHWRSDVSAGLPQWFIIDMAGFKRIDGFLYNNRIDPYQDALPKHITFEISLDKTNWQKVLDIEDLPGSRALQVLPVGQTVVAKYIRVTVLSTRNGDNFSYIGDIGIYAGDQPESEQDIERWNWIILGYSSTWNTVPENVLNDHLNSCWVSEPFDTALNGMPQWFSVDMKKELLITGFIVHNRMDDPASTAFPKKVRYDVSNDGVTWTTAIVVDAMPNVMMGYHRVVLPKPVKARYFKFTVESNWANAPWTFLAYISIF